MYHLMRYYILNIPTANWPACITLAWNNEVTCGIKQLVTSEIELKNKLNNSTQFETEVQQLITNQTSSLSSLECVANISSYWKDVYLLLLKRISGQELNEQDILALDNIAKKCAYEFGDAVHWARGLLSGYNAVNYQPYDNCSLNTQQRSRKSIKSFDDYEVYPNPSTGIFS